MNKNLLASVKLWTIILIFSVGLSECKVTRLLTKKDSLNNTSSNSTESLIKIDPASIFNLTEQEFRNAVLFAGYGLPTHDKFIKFASGVVQKANITSKREMAMFLTHCIWETDGLKATREYCYVENGCGEDYVSKLDYPGQKYYGRGYLQITWASSYIDASKFIFNDDRLFKEPDLVGKNDTLAWDTAFWYWRTYVHSKPGIEEGKFGAATRAINGFLECDNGPNVKKARKRFELYTRVLKSFRINEKPIESGCYN